MCRDHIACSSARATGRSPKIISGYLYLPHSFTKGGTQSGSPALCPSITVCCFLVLPAADEAKADTTVELRLG